MLFLVWSMFFISGGKDVLRLKDFIVFDEVEISVVSVSFADIGKIVAQSIVDYFKDDYNKKIIKNLFKNGISIVYTNKNATNKLSGKIFVLTGTLPTLTRPEATKIIEDNGGSVSSSVSKQTSYVLLGEDAGSKLQKAIALGIPTISETEFLDMLK